MTTKQHLGALVAVCLSALSACGGSSGAGSAPPSRPTTTVPPTTIASPTAPTTVPASTTARKDLFVRVAAEQTDTRLENRALLAFVDRVTELSGGEITVRVTWDVEQPSNPPLHRTYGMVRDDLYDMGWLPAREWGTEGATSASALQAPLLVRSREQAIAVVQDQEVVTSVLGGLGAAGVVGLGLYPEDFRWLSTKGPLPTPANVAGDAIQAPLSKETNDWFRALGLAVEPWKQSGNLREAAAETQSLLEQGTIVGNLPIYFKFLTLVAGERFWSGLTDEQRGILQQAAQDVQARFATDDGAEEIAQGGAAAYCARGGTVATIDDARIAAFEASAQPTISAMRADPLTSRLIDRITELGQGTSPTTLRPCGPVASEPVGDFPQGVYRYEITDDDLRRADIPAGDWAADRGTYTYTLHDGTFEWTQEGAADQAGPTSGSGTYVVDGNRITITEPAGHDMAQLSTVLQWSVGPDRSLRFAIVDSPGDLAYVRFTYGEPWLRIADAP